MATLNITLTLPDTQSKRIKDSFVAYHGWTATVSDPADPEKEIANPVSKEAFIKQKVIELIKNSVKAYEANQSAEIARKSKIAEIDSISIE